MIIDTINMEKGSKKLKCRNRLIVFILHKHMKHCSNSVIKQSTTVVKQQQCKIDAIIVNANCIHTIVIISIGNVHPFNCIPITMAKVIMLHIEMPKYTIAEQVIICILF